MNIDSPYIIVIGGPTGSGKTDLAIEVAKILDTEIINTDSRQLYKELDIGVAKPTLEQLSEVKHHFISEFSIHEEMNAGKFAELARVQLTDIMNRKGKVVISGGTGLYIQALLFGIDQTPAIPNFIRRHVDKTYMLHGINALKAQLIGINPTLALTTELQNPARVKRALEIAMMKESEGTLLKNSLDKLPYQTFTFYTNPDRNVLYQNINNRVDNMVLKGLENEAATLHPIRHLKALQTVGYSEYFDYFNGNSTLEECINLIKQHTRNYAKRQITWFKNKFDSIPLQFPDPILTIFEELKKHGRHIYK